MNKLTLWLVAVSLLTTSQPTVANAQFGSLFGGSKVETIDTEELHKLLTAHQQAEAKAKESGSEPSRPDFVVVDVRSDAEINVSVIPGAITKAQFEKNKQLYEGRTVIPYCTVGGRSGAYAKQLAGSGMKVKNYQGSILKWIDAGLPLVTLDGKPTHRVHTHSSRYRVPEKYEQVAE